MTINVSVQKNLALKHKDAEYANGLLEFLAQVQLVRPLFEFVASDKCINVVYINDGTEMKQVPQITKVVVTQDGEDIGAIGVGTRYFRGEKSFVYNISSFRINRERGEENTTTTANSKVALRNIKKLFVPRADNELQTLIKDKVDHKCVDLMHDLNHSVRWSIDDDEEGMNYALLAYLARAEGKQFVELPVIPPTVKDQEKYLRACADYYEFKEIDELRRAKKGYGVMMRPDEAYIVYNYATEELLRYKTFMDMPEKFQSKLAVFKLLKNKEVCPFGVMFKPEDYNDQKLGSTFFFIKD